MDKLTYRKEYRMRLVGVGGVEVTLPSLVVDKAARKEGQTLEEFAKTHRVVHLFNAFPDFDGAYRFERFEPTEELDASKYGEPKKPRKQVESITERAARMQREMKGK